MPTIRIKIAQGKQVPTKLTHGELGICNDRLYFGKKGDIPQAVALPGDKLPALTFGGDHDYAPDIYDGTTPMHIREGILIVRQDDKQINFRGRSDGEIRIGDGLKLSIHRENALAVISLAGKFVDWTADVTDIFTWKSNQPFGASSKSLSPYITDFALITFTISIAKDLDYTEEYTLTVPTQWLEQHYHKYLWVGTEHFDKLNDREGFYVNLTNNATISTSSNDWVGTRDKTLTITGCGKIQN